MKNHDTVQDLLKKKDFRKLQLYVDLGFEISLTDHNADSVEKFGDQKNILYEYIISGKLSNIKKCSKKLFNTQNNQGYTPFHWAIICHRNEIIDFLIDESTNHLLNTATGENCFSLAARFNNTYAFNKLIEKLGTKSIMNNNERGFNALLFSAARKNQSILRTMLNVSSIDNLRSKNIYGANFLHWIFHGKNISDEYKEMLMKSLINLLEKKIGTKAMQVMLQEKNSIGYTPAAWLVHYKNSATINFLSKKFII